MGRRNNYTSHTSSDKVCTLFGCVVRVVVYDDGRVGVL